MKKREKPMLVRAKFIDPKTGKSGMLTINVADIQDAPFRSRVPLSAKQSQRAKRLWEWVGRFAEPERGESAWIDDFRLEPLPDYELMVWERIAEVCDLMWQHPASQRYHRTVMTRAIVGILSGLVDVPSEHGVSDEFVELVRTLAAGKSGGIG